MTRDEILQAAEDVYDGWYADSQIDWQDFIDRLENLTDHDFGSSMVSTEIQAVQRHVRKYKTL